jgi:phosphomannomutase
MAAPFKAYDIRGVYGQDVTDSLAYDLGRTFANYLKGKTIVVGRDMRPAGESLQKNLVRGLTEQGATVIDIGLASTDMFYFAVIEKKADGGVIITASHNPAQYNGFKLTREKAIPIGIDSGLAEIEKTIRAGRFPPPARKPGRVERCEMLDDFVAFMHGFVKPKELAPLKVVIDCGNGMGGMVIPKLLQGSPLTIIPLYFELDGTFPHHEANPLIEENRRDLIRTVLREKADLGIGLDGDTDRAFFVDDRGEFCSADFILGLLAKPILKAHPGAKIVYDVRCSNYVRDTVKKFGGTAHMGKVGHAYAKIFMREIGAEFGGELSGHYYYRYQDAFFDSGNLTCLLLLQALSEKKEKLSQALAETREYHISGEINSTVKDQDAAVKRVLEQFRGKGRVVEIDGVSVIGPTWWLNVRKSNTEPLVRLNCEADTRENMEKLRDEALALIRA